MIIDSKQQLAGFPILEIRRLLRYGHRSVGAGSPGWGLSLVQAVLGTSEAKASHVVKVLQQEEYVEEVVRPEKIHRWRNTPNGNALALATAAKPLRRATAEKKLAEFLNRVRQVRNSAEFLYKVDKVVVFGSFLSTKERIGDIDIAIGLSPKVQDPDERMKLEHQHTMKAERAGRQFATFHDELLWPRREVWLFLKGRSRAISLHPIEDPVLKQTEFKVIYQDEG